ncbi:MAG: hypothetical protein UX31_C0016G0005 [Candidatus Nomurabacteria bacterium GW2011_GWA1_46_11]|uniref:Uncharacterized protein n=1 Tax=Candidatus Nomurabacteria bacterium GW2011_GWA1_46_11 TaxID=1618732 RepID=A0A0G1QUN5_9BACT|nr:MAG: hypothetical protein UW69_C0012G0005 [Microgenomates group bacterium GW2011_GWA2_44_7]KKT77387.1 MAG: hypothetical protein UW73_C0021G0020 [Microgenomates group bacterium GW2011_GWB1_44_8]KKU21528.1 MAG: hypothetical protein UX31_C0016G0005 [Candidatus Nomurabacteria bacterium GW2011_GWA1_46_11]
MLTPQSQIKVNLPISLKDYLESKANKFGMPLAGYIKHLILKDVADMAYPTFEASESTVKAYKKALKEKSKAVEAKDLKQFFKDL